MIRVVTLKNSSEPQPTLESIPDHLHFDRVGTSWYSRACIPRDMRYELRTTRPEPPIFMNLSARSATFVLASLLATSGCTSRDTSREQPTSAAAERIQVSTDDSKLAVPTEEAVNPYSPFGVQVFENQHFDVVTFKDVGVGHFPGQRDPLLESIADSLAINMSIDPTMPYRAHLVHNEKFADPDSHIYCEMNHIYVDIWTATEPDRFGYSLWSGCSETDQFAWEELPINLGENGEYFGAIEELTGHIADRIRDADSRECFTQTC